MCLSEDSLPFISQFKSLLFLLHCDPFGALQTQITFTKQFIILSQIRSLIQWFFYNDISGAKQTQIEFYHESILPFPLLSQIISILFLLIYCDKESSWRVQQKFINKLTNLITIPIRLIYYICNCQMSVGRQVSVPNTSPFTTWMSDHFNHVPLRALTLVGTHNAHSYKLRRATSIASNIARCQNLSIYRQLICGSRCLDIRLCNFEDELWCAHGHCNTVRFINIVQQVMRFIKQYPSEVILLRCKTEWDWRHKPNNPVMRQQIMDVIRNCDRADEYCAPLNGMDDVLSLSVGELAAKQWNIILFHECDYGNHQIVTSWGDTKCAFAQGLIAKIKKWIAHKVYLNSAKKVYVKEEMQMYESVKKESNKQDLVDGDQEYQMNVHLDNEEDKKILWLVNGQITPVVNCKYVLFMIITGFFGLGCDVELVNAEMIKNINERELFKLNVWDMDFIHPVLVKKIIDTNLKYCGSNTSSTK